MSSKGNSAMMAVALLVTAMALILSAGCFGGGGGQQCNTITVNVGVFADSAYSHPISDNHIFHYSVQLVKTTTSTVCDQTCQCTGYHCHCGSYNNGDCMASHTVTTVTDVGPAKDVYSAQGHPSSITLYMDAHNKWHITWRDRDGDHDDQFDVDFQDTSVAYSIVVTDVDLSDAYNAQTPDGFILDWINDGGSSGHWHCHWYDRFHRFHEENWDGSSCAEQSVSFNYELRDSCSDVSCEADETCVNGQCIPNQCGDLIVGYTCTRTTGQEGCPGGYSSQCTDFQYTCTGDTGNYCPEGYTYNGGTCKMIGPCLDCQSQQVCDKTCSHTHCKSDGSTDYSAPYDYDYGDCLHYTTTYCHTGSGYQSCGYRKEQTVQITPKASCPAGYTKQGSYGHYQCVEGPVESCDPVNNLVQTLICNSYDCTKTITSGTCPAGDTATEITHDYGLCPDGYTCLQTPQPNPTDGVCIPITPPPDNGGGGGANIGGGEVGDSGYDAAGWVFWDTQRPPICNVNTNQHYSWYASNTTDTGNYIEIFDALDHLVYGPAQAIGTNQTVGFRRNHNGAGSYFINVPTTPQNNLASRWQVVLLGIDPIDGPIPRVIAVDKMFVRDVGSTYAPPTETPIANIVVGSNP